LIFIGKIKGCSIEKVIRLYQAGKKQQEIDQSLLLAQSSVSRIIILTLAFMQNHLPKVDADNQ
jgi:hypothetical protein